MRSVQSQGDRWEARFYRMIEPEIEAENSANSRDSLEVPRPLARAALNYLAYQLALAAIRENPGLKGQLKPESVEFPIFTQPKLLERKTG